MEEQDLELDQVPQQHRELLLYEALDLEGVVEQPRADLPGPVRLVEAKAQPLHPRFLCPSN